ncbi:hypothetical protein AMTR_s00065p00155500 [Amborella trichopoda]|uniref:Uncharacterized protein n=1 Tax=Amborella trichopoda TaxID=13333 RepID=U5D821_AMBTC|nr:hypothetical protein AMTR_s00065p00155500 [Amborella trichopoda]
MRALEHAGASAGPLSMRAHDTGSSMRAHDTGSLSMLARGASTLCGQMVQALRACGQMARAL